MIFFSVILRCQNYKPRITMSNIYPIEEKLSGDFEEIDTFQNYPCKNSVFWLIHKMYIVVLLTIDNKITVPGGKIDDRDKDPFSAGKRETGEEYRDDLPRLTTIAKVAQKHNRSYTAHYILESPSYLKAELGNCPKCKKRGKRIRIAKCHRHRETVAAFLVTRQELLDFCNGICVNRKCDKQRNGEYKHCSRECAKNDDTCVSFGCHNVRNGRYEHCSHKCASYDKNPKPRRSFVKSANAILGAYAF